MDLSRAAEAARLAAELETEYERFYYSGIVAERMGKSQLARGGPSSDDYANRALHKAMAWYEKAESIRPTGEDDAILRWNTCARTISRRGFTVPGAKTGSFESTPNHQYCSKSKQTSRD